MSFKTLSKEELKEKYEKARKKVQDTKGIDTGYIDYLTALELELRNRDHDVRKPHLFPLQESMKER